MSNTVIQIKRSLTNAQPSSLSVAELGYSYLSNTMFIGTPDGTGTIAVGGKSFFDLINSSFGIANAAFNAANGAGSLAIINLIYQTANAGYNTANAAYDYANNLSSLEAASFNVANAAFDKANTAKSNSFTTISSPGQSNITSGIEDTLTLSGSDNINISTNADSKTVSFSVTPGSYNGDYGLITEPAIFTHDYGSL